MTRNTGIALLLFALTSTGCEAGFGVETQSDAIVGGAPTAGDPAVALLIITDAEGNVVGTCSGTLIASDAVLTAAHCIDPTRGYWVYFGTQWVEGDPGEIFMTFAVEYSIAPGWDGNIGNPNDAAILLLDSPVPVAPMPLMREPITSSMLGESLLLVGWGRTGGGASDSGTKRAVTSSLFDFDDDFLLVGDGVTNTCQGDSGGPAFMNVRGVKTLVGITSFGDEACAEAGVDVRVDAQLDFIDAVLGIDDGGPTDNGGDDTDDTDDDSADSPGNFGDTCSNGGECNSGICVDRGDGIGMCTRVCTSDSVCGTGFDCVSAGDESVCYPSDDDDTIFGGDEGNGGAMPLGCSAAGSDTSAMMSCLLVLVLAGITRRRRAARAN